MLTWWATGCLLNCWSLSTALHKAQPDRYVLAERAAAAADAAVALAGPKHPGACVGRGVNVPATTAQTGPQEDSQSGLSARGLSRGQSAVPDSPDVWGFAIPPLSLPFSCFLSFY